MADFAPMPYNREFAAWCSTCCGWLTHEKFAIEELTERIQNAGPDVPFETMQDWIRQLDHLQETEFDNVLREYPLD